MGGGGAEVWVSHPFSQLPSAVPGSCPYAFLQPRLHQRGCARGGHPRLNCQGCSGASSTSISGLLQPSCLSCGRPQGRGVQSSTSPTSIALWMCPIFRWRPSSLFSCQGDWMASIDLKEAYLQVPVHPESRPFLRFVSKGHVFQFKALCFGLSTAPQVFSRVMAPVSAILHAMGIRMRRYLDDWLVQSSSRESLLRDLQTVLRLCHELGVVINREKSHLVPSQVVQYLSVVINTQSFVASPSPDRISRLLSTAGEF